MTETLRFDEAEHAYTLAGVRLPSVTQIIEAAGLVELFGNAEQLAYARDRGTAIHVATELDDMGDLDESTVVAEIIPQLAAWRRFRAESGFVPEHVELRLHHPQLRYAGTIDRICTMRRHRGLVDVKSGAPRRATGVQLAAYVELAAANGLVRRDIKRYACHLFDDGTYQLIPYTSPRDLPTFMAARALHAWRNAA